MRWAAVLRVLPLALALVPLAVAVWAAARYTVDIPWMDEWELVPLVERSYQGTLSLRDLWLLHNEHRFVFPRLILIGLVRATHWNVYWEVGLNVALACAIALLLIRQMRGTGRRLGELRWEWTALPVSVVVFSLSQWENWIWGWQVAIFLNVLAAAGMVVLLGGERLSWWMLAAAALCAAVAQYSFANGVACWAIGAAALAVRPFESRRRRVRAIAVWLAAAAVVVGSYLYGYYTPTHHPALAACLEQPGQLAQYVLIYLGRPLGEGHAAWMGLAGLAYLGGATWGLVRFGFLRGREVAPYVWLSSYAILSALITGVGRVGFGRTQALTPRYVTIANLLWVAVAALLFFLGAGLLRRKRRGLGGLAYLAVAAIVAASLMSSGEAVPKMRTTSERLAAARAEVWRAEDEELLQVLYPDVSVLKERIAKLRELKLSVFREGASPPVAEDARPDRL